MKVPKRKLLALGQLRSFSTSASRREIRGIAQLADRIYPSYHRECCKDYSNEESTELTLTETQDNDLLSLNWPSPPRNILLVHKRNAPVATTSLVEFAKCSFSPMFSAHFL